MKLVPLTDIFNIRYGNQFDFSKMDVCKVTEDKSIAFIGRSEMNQGVVAQVYEFEDKEPFEAGLITVAMGGSMLASFVQTQSFYTAQNVKVLTPKENLTLQEKLYYCAAIEANRFRYSTFGREANSTFNNIKVPAIESIPSEVKLFTPEKSLHLDAQQPQSMALNTQNWQSFKLNYLFDIIKGKRLTKEDMDEGEIRFIGSTEYNNGITEYVANDEHLQDGNLITVAYNGSVAESFYQDAPFVASDDINILKPKNFALNCYNAMFLITLLSKEKYRYSYGRKWNKSKMEQSTLKLPVTSNHQPDWLFMEQYIKSLPYSSNL